MQVNDRLMQIISAPLDDPQLRFIRGSEASGIRYLDKDRSETQLVAKVAAIHPIWVQNCRTIKALNVISKDVISTVLFVD
jgi:hypothetical protein